MTIAVTAVSGQLGRAIAQALLDMKLDQPIIGLARTPAKVTGLGIDVRPGDYDQPDDLKASLAGVDTLLLVSGLAAPDVRIQQHRNVIDAARAAGVRVEIVPGISAANGAAAAAQIALTHRDASSIVSFVAGQCKGLKDQDWAGLAGKGRTLVIYMGVKTAPQIAEKLMEDGLAPDMPVAVIENGARPEMRVLRAPLAGLPDLVEAEQVVSPALIVIGEVTARDNLSLAALAQEAAR